MSYKIYCLEEDLQLSKAINIALKKSNYDIYCFDNELDLINQIKKEIPELLLLDLSNIEAGNTEILDRINEFNEDKYMQIVVIGYGNDKDFYMNLGIDAFFEKPIDIVKLANKISVQEKKGKTRNLIVLDNITLNPVQYTLRVDKKPVYLTTGEFKVLYRLMSTPNQAVTREELCKILWGEDNKEEYKIRVIDVHIANLREKIKSRRKIKSVCNIGYKFVYK